MPVFTSDGWNAVRSRGTNTRRVVSRAPAVDGLRRLPAPQTVRLRASCAVRRMGAARARVISVSFLATPACFDRSPSVSARRGSRRSLHLTHFFCGHVPRFHDGHAPSKTSRLSVTQRSLAWISALQEPPGDPMSQDRYSKIFEMP